MTVRTQAPAFQFGTKAETLHRLRSDIAQARILDLVYFTVEQFRRRPATVLQRIGRKLGGEGLVVRSSAIGEDGNGRSMAGAFTSVLGVDGSDTEALRSAIERVSRSMTGNPRDQVLVQPMLQGVAVSGVLMTYDVVRGAPYYVINFDDETGRTDSITAGSGTHKALLVYRGAPHDSVQSPRVARFLALARELEALCGTAPLDIEFALTHAAELYLLQVRRIAAASNWHPVTERRVARQLVFVENFVNECSAPRAGLWGRRTILAMMPDWNPAEIIGSTPRPLAASLYRKLVTRSVWREARAYMGYRRLPPVELMLLINHHPYIDVRASFNSFVPAELDADTGAAVVDSWLDRLEEHPDLHDKVEFQVAQTCRDFSFDESARESLKDRLGRTGLRRFRVAAARLTARNLSLQADATLGAALGAVAGLEQVQTGRGWEPIARLPARERLARAVLLLEECEQSGTLAFAVIARHAFIAEALLRSAAARGALEPERVEAFKRSVTTVTSGMLSEYHAVCCARMQRDAFLARFGHLRPGTYDITSLRYDERDDLFLDAVAERASAAAPTFALKATERRGLTALLAEAGYGHCTAADLVEYARRAIAGREHAKFVFTRNLSDALCALVSWGEAQGLSRDDLSFLDWSAIELTLSRPVIDYTDRYLLSLADAGRRDYAEADAFRLAHIIRGVRDVLVATLHRSSPNFVGSGHSVGPVAVLDAHTPASANLYGRIVCIENADPGYDWIFTKAIRALVTKFGGTNSHMAIRCAELGLPAAIGCGEQTYARLVTAGAIELNCAGKVLRPVRET